VAREIDRLLKEIIEDKRRRKNSYGKEIPREEYV